MKKIIFVNQTANYLFADILKAYAAKLPELQIEAWYGTLDYDIGMLPNNVKLLQGPGYDRQSFSSRFRSWVRFYLWMRKQLKSVDKKSTGFYFISNPPLFVFLPYISKLKFDCLIYDLYPDVLGDMRKKKLINAIAKRWEKRNRKVFPKAQHIYTIGEGLRNAIVRYLPPEMEAKVQIVPVWNKHTTAKSKSGRNFKLEWGLENKKVILYSGNIGLTHPLEYLVEIGRRLQGNTDWIIVIVGNGAKKNGLKLLAEGLNNLLFKDPVPFEDLSELLSIADWGYVTLDSSATNTSVPSKTYNLLAAGVPILAFVNQQSDIARLIDVYKVGLYFKEQEIDHMLQQIVGMSDAETASLSENAISCSAHFTLALADIFANNWIADNV